MALKNPTTKDIALHRETGLSFNGEKIIIGKRKGRPPRRIYNPENGWWSQEKKIEACTLYAALGSIPDVSRLTNVPENFIRGWKTEQWWIDVTQQIIKEDDEQLSSRFTNVVKLALDKLQTVLEQGNTLYLPKDDRYVNVPLTAGDLTKVAAAFTDKRQIIQGKPTSRTEAISSDDRLKKLAAQFEKFSKAKEVKQVAIEGELVIEEEDNETPST